MDLGGRGEQPAVRCFHGSEMPPRDDRPKSGTTFQGAALTKETTAIRNPKLLFISFKLRLDLGTSGPGHTPLRQDKASEELRM
eukprot:6091011-Pyramimonas_sp.AAC.1